MTTEFAAITDEFDNDLDAIRSLVNTFDDPRQSTPKVRVSAANAATLLLAATFEEFVRAMARAYARAVVDAAGSFAKLPRKLANTAWRRTMETLARLRIDDRARFSSADGVSDPQTRFEIIYEFCKGDLAQDIYNDLIFNENNMRPREINSLFSVSGLTNVCRKVSDKEAVVEHFDEHDRDKAHGQLISSLDEFFDRRNGIAHSLNSGSSSSPDRIRTDIDTFCVFGKSLCETLNSI